MASAISGRSSSPSSPPGPAVATHRLPQVWKVRDLRQGDLQQTETRSNLRGLQTDKDLQDTWTRQNQSCHARTFHNNRQDG